jgi:predicted kinase
MELVIFIGLQASGKTTFYRARFAQTHTHVSKDNFPNNRNPERRQRELIGQAFAEGRSVVVDNTNATVEARQPLLALAHAHNVPVIGYHFASSMEGCLRRNEGREGKARVPPVALYATRKKLQPPSVTEGFARLFHVRLVNDNEWEVTDWREEEA